MTKVYLNYPNPHMTLHGDSTCVDIGKMRKTNQRAASITPASFTEVLGHFADKSFRLESKGPANDVWLSIDFGDPEFEEAVAKHVLRILAKRYRPLQGAAFKRHCPR